MSKLQQVKQRAYYLDNICCILIIHLIYTGHIADSCGDDEPRVISWVCQTLSFVMSWFFFKGGMMHKETSTRKLIEKSTQRLLVPFVIFLFLGLLLDGAVLLLDNPEGLNAFQFLRNEFDTFVTTSILWPTAAIWFLLALFVARIGFNALFHRIHPLLISLFFSCTAYLIYLSIEYGWTVDVCSILSLPPFYLGTMCHGFSLYCLGYYLKEKQFSTPLFVVSLLLFILKFLIPASIDFRANEPSGANYMLAVLYGMSGCIVINNIFRKYLNFKIPCASYIGVNSMTYYLVHFPVLVVSRTMLGKTYLGDDFWLRFVILSVVVTISLVIADCLFRNQKLRFMIGG